MPLARGADYPAASPYALNTSLIQTTKPDGFCHFVEGVGAGLDSCVQINNAERLYHHLRFIVTHKPVDCQAMALLPYMAIIVILPSLICLVIVRKQVFIFDPCLRRENEKLKTDNHFRSFPCNKPLLS